MAEVFLKIVNMSISASWMVLVALVFRKSLKGAPKWMRLLLWAFVAIRLICPFSLKSTFSLMPEMKINNQNVETEYEQKDISISNVGGADAPDFITSSSNDMYTTDDKNIVNDFTSSSSNAKPEASADPVQIWLFVLSIVWIAGILLMLAYTGISYWRLRRKISTAVLLKDNIYQSENIVSPFVLGIIRPKIYLPCTIGEQDIKHIIAHEAAHISRRDYLWKPMGFLILTLHWFNPLIWLSYVLLCRDIELSCDEKVINKMDQDLKADYSQALLSCSVNRRVIAACPIAFGELGVKERVKAVISYKKPVFGLVVVALISCIAVAFFFLTDPDVKTKKDDSEEPLTTEKPIPVGDETTNVSDDFTPILKVNDVLYYGSDEVGPMGDADCVEGYIQTSVAEDEIPSENEESNFGCIGNPYTRDENGNGAIQVLMDDDSYHWFYSEDYTKVSMIESLQGNVNGSDDYIETVKLMKYEESEESDFHNTYIEIVTPNTSLVYELERQSMEEEIYLCDVDGDSLDEIVLHSLLGMSGGAGQYISEVFKVENDTVKCLFCSETYNEDGSIEVFDTGFRGEFLEGKMLMVTNEITGTSSYIDISGRYDEEVFDDEGRAALDCSLYCDDFFHFKPIDKDNDGVYEIECIQYASINWHANGVGNAYSILKYKPDSGVFEVVQADFLTD